MDAVKVSLRLSLLFVFIPLQMFELLYASRFLKTYLSFRSFFSLFQVDLDAFVVSLKIQLAGMSLSATISDVTRIIIHQFF